MRLTVRATKASYQQTPLWAAVVGRVPKEPLLLAGTGEPIPAQLVERHGTRYLVWVEPDLPRGAEKRYELRPASVAPKGFEAERTERAITLRYRGQPLTAYVFRDAPKPYLYPLYGPNGKPITRHFPMQIVQGESMDHLHHRSVWFTHGEVNGIDFWSEGPGKGTIVNRAIGRVEAGPVLARIEAQNDWLAPDGKKVCEETTEIIAVCAPNITWIDYAVTIHASEGEVRFGDTKEGTFGVRVASSMEVKRGQGGQIVNAVGQRDREAWGKRAEWCDYTGPVGGEIVGIAIFDHPENLRHPTYWHVRDYGLFAANPFGIHDFVPGTPKGTGDFVLKRGESFTLRYRLCLHKGRTEEANIAQHYLAFKHPAEVQFQR
ncbi:MAG: PmoA family protein [Armatimonadota bacterium]